MSPDLAAILARRRDALNGLFARARLLYPRLQDESWFVSSFSYQAEELLRAIQANDEMHRPGQDAVDELIQALFEQTLVLCGKNYLANSATGGARLPEFPELWRRMLTAAPQLALAAPGRHLASIANALTRALQTENVDAAAFCTEWLAFAKPRRRISIDVFEQAGCVIAWRHGMALFRSAALSAAAALCRKDPVAACASLGLNAAEIQDAAEQTPALIEALAANPWRTPADALDLSGGARSDAAKTRPPVLRRVGAFAGFGGEFVRPPEALWTARGPLFDDRESLYVLHIDVFGHAFRPVRLEDQDLGESWTGANPTGDSALSLQDGVVVADAGAGERRYDAPQLKGASSWTTFGNHSLLATLPDSHMVYVIGFPY